MAHQHITFRLSQRRLQGLRTKHLTPCSKMYQYTAPPPVPAGMPLLSYYEAYRRAQLEHLARVANMVNSNVHAHPNTTTNPNASRSFIAPSPSYQDAINGTSHNLAVGGPPSVKIHVVRPQFTTFCVVLMLTPSLLPGVHGPAQPNLRPASIRPATLDLPDSLACPCPCPCPDAQVSSLLLRVSV